jgi:hypothetical protein
LGINLAYFLVGTGSYTSLLIEEERSTARGSLVYDQNIAFGGHKETSKEELNIVRRIPQRWTYRQPLFFEGLRLSEE